MSKIADINLCFGYQTVKLREEWQFPKQHHIDAACIACLGSGLGETEKSALADPFKIKQFRNHNRALIHCQKERTYKLDKKIIAKNRRPRFEQPSNIPAFSQWYEEKANEIGKKDADRLVNRVVVIRVREAITIWRGYYPEPYFYIREEDMLCLEDRATENTIELLEPVFISNIEIYMNISE